MTLDKSLLEFFRRSALATILIVPFAACGDDVKTTDDEDTTDDSATADDGDQGDDTDSPTGRVDSGAKDASTKDSGKAPADAGGSETADAGSKLDGGGSNAGKNDSGTGTVAPPTGGYQRGPAPTSASASTKGPYQFKTYTDGYPDSPKYADSTIHYPVDADPPYTIMAIVPGFVSPQSSIQNWGPFLASHGIVTMTIGTNTPTDLPADREAALLDAIKTLEGENTRDGSPVKGKLDLSREATGGWSMGGGGTLLAAVDKPSLKATMAICPWNPGYDYSKIKVPTLFFAGTADVLAGGQSQPFYESIADSTPKLLWEVNGADHFYANDPAGQSGAVGRYGLSFVKVFLEGDERYRQFLKEKGPNASDFRTNM